MACGAEKDAVTMRCRRRKHNGAPAGRGTGQTQARHRNTVPLANSMIPNTKTKRQPQMNADMN
jgi:hypothetical protein